MPLLAAVGLAAFGIEVVGLIRLRSVASVEIPPGTPAALGPVPVSGTTALAVGLRYTLSAYAPDAASSSDIPFHLPFDYAAVDPRGRTVASEHLVASERGDASYFSTATGKNGHWTWSATLLGTPFRIPLPAPLTIHATTGPVAGAGVAVSRLRVILFDRARAPSMVRLFGGGVLFASALSALVVERMIRRRREAGAR